MRRYVLIGCLSLMAVVRSLAQEPCKFGSEDAYDVLVKALSEAKSCDAAVAKMHDCAWGSSADTQFVPIVIKKCESTFFEKLSPAAQKSYGEEMQLCAYEYARQEGTMYMSAAALCQVDVAAEFAANPQAASKRAARASFDCDKAQTPLEKAICSDIGLGHADIILSRVYSGILKNSNEKERAALIQSERQWLRDTPKKCGLTAPPFSGESLNCVRNEFETRFGALDDCQEGILGCLRNADDQAKRAQSVSSPRASFDCEAPSSGLEIVICADAELGQLDIALAEAYKDASTVMAAGQNKDLIGSERQWLRFVSETCPLGVVGGIPSVFARSCVRSALQIRIAQLRTCPPKELQQRLSCLNDFHVLDKK